MPAATREYSTTMSETARKLVYFHIAPIPSRRANAVQVVNTCSALAQAGVAVELYCIRASETVEQIYAEYDVPPFPIRTIGSGTKRFVASTIFRSIAARRILKDQSLVYTRDIGSAFVAALLRRPFIYELHVLPYKWAQRLMLKYIVRDPSLVRIASITKGLETDLMGWLGEIDPERRIVIPCAATLPRDLPAFSDTPGKRLKVGYVGHFFLGKGAGLFRALAERHPDMDFHVVGMIEDPALLGDVPSNIILHGALPHEAAMARLADLDIVLAPYTLSSTDGIVNLSRWFSPLKLFEYLAYGKPIICSNLDVIREVLIDGENALLAPPDDIEAWSGALSRLRDDTALRKRLAEYGPKLVEEKYSYARRAEQIIDAAF